MSARRYSTAVTTGLEWLGEPTLAGPVVVLDLEEAEGDLLRRLAIHQADPERVTYCCITPEPLESLEAVARLVWPL